MGQRCCQPCPLKKEELDEYELLTFLTRAEIVRAFSAFSRLDAASVEANRDARLPVGTVVAGTPCLAAHPIGDRVCHAFSSERDGRMSFDDYLDMYSVMSPRSNPGIKTHFAFLAYDFDGDGVIGKSDLGKVVDR